MVIGNHSRLLSWGWIGVDLFFVISGYLVSGLLFRDYTKTGAIHIANFVTRRGFKIYPAYYLFVAITAIVFAANGVGFPASNIWHDLLFVQNYADGTYAHLWSLAVEEHFYIALPVGLWWLTKRKCREPFSRLPIVCGGIGLLCLLMRTYLAFTQAPAFSTFATPTHVRIDSLTFGVLLSYLCEFRPAVIEKLLKLRWLVLVISLALLVPSTVVPWEKFFTHTLGYSFLYLGFGGLRILALKCTTGESWIVVGLSKIGLYSYTIYLVHVPVIRWVASHGMGSDGHYRTKLVIVASMILSICFGALFAKIVEVPFLKLRDRLIPRPDLGKAVSVASEDQLHRGNPPPEDQLGELDGSRPAQWQGAGSN
jgi:peptidoglycan/LPS O-acetylase OafA/YrhL